MSFSSKNEKNLSGGHGGQGLLLTLLICLAGAFMFSNPAAAKEGSRNYCAKTARLLHKACHRDLREEMLVLRADCLNIEDGDDREDCRADAAESKAEELELCSDQFDARRDLCSALGKARYDPDIDPANFVDPLTIGDTTAANPFLPLIPGYTRVYEAEDETVTVTVTDETVEIQGVTCIVVTDVVEEEGEAIEITDDWMAQDIYGNVWYCGEIAKNFEDGFLTDIDGSFRAGIDGAKMGILMPANPVVGDIYRQEWALTEAEDVAEVISLDASETVPAAGASCDGTCLQTQDSTPLEPDAVEYKFYAPGIGPILAYDVEEPEDREELVDYYFD